MKKSFLITILLLGIFLITKDVYAKTTLSVCNSGYDYSNFEEIYNDYRNNTLTDKDLTIEVGEGEYYDKNYLDSISDSYDVSVTIKGASRENTKLYGINFDNSMMLGI